MAACRQDTVNILKAEGYKFPPLKESDAMFSADTAPEWADGEVCHRCRVAFSLMVRRHHCRACGQVFCQQCSSKNSTLPKFGIEKEVRVCDACYDKVSRPPSSSAKLEIVDTTSDYGPTQPQKRPGKSAEELQEEEELQLALALSQSEAEHKEKEKRTRTHIAPDPAPHHPTVSPTPSSVSASPEHAAPHAELSRYLDRNYWEQRLTRDAAAPTAPASHAPHAAHASHAPSDVSEDYAKQATSKMQEDDSEDKEIDEFVETLKSQLEIFVNRMKSNSSRGRSIANDTSVQTLFMNITAMHSRLLRYIQQQDDKRVYLESLQDKINQIRDSRAALDTLRAEHAARLAAAAEAAERQRQMQMAAKLHAMRKKKHEYLQYQRQLALQRVQEQEREMQMRQEQQKHQYMMSAGGGYYMPGVSMHQFQPGYPNQPVYANPQFHPQMMPQTTDGAASLPGQPLMSQASVPMPVNQMGTISQSMPQLTNTFAMSTSGMAISQAPMGTQSSMNQNVRPNLGQLPPMQQQMLMQQMHQMRMSQPGVHQMMSVNGLPGTPQQNGQKQNLPNQQPPTSMMASMSLGQGMVQPQMSQANAMMGMQMPNMRMPMMPGQNVNQPAVSGYQLNQPNTQQPSQVPGQPMSLPGQQIMQGQNQNMTPGQIPPSQNVPGQQMSQSHNQQLPQQPLQQGQPMPMQGQTMQPGQQMNMQGQPMLSQGQNLPQQGQHMNMQGQQMSLGQMPPAQQNQPMMHGQVPQQMQMGQVQQQIPQQMGQGQPMTQGQQNSPPQQISQGQQMPQSQMPQGQPIPQNNQGQPLKMPQQNFSNGPPQPPPNQAQTPVKSEHNNNTAELISFD